MTQTVETYITFCRILMVVLTAEVAIRYAVWWRKLSHHSYLLRKLMLGIAVNGIGFLFLMMFALTYARTVDPRSPFFVPLPIGYSVMVVGMLLHLVPCWQITCDLSGRRVTAEIAWRAVLAMVSAIYLSA